uniref:N-acetylglucosaminylphosphatidylinositol deacetylase n=1 Tax=Strongyloides venezuelensis TaxID=75913 RepID=A0A0K0EVS9_STRVS
MIILVAVLYLFLFVLSIYFAISGNRRIKVNNESRILIVTAHPDDETMFFSPTIRDLVSTNNEVYILCVTSGDFYGQGRERKKELVNAVKKLGVKQGNVLVMDLTNYKDGPKKWEKEKLSKHILNHVEKLDINIVLTFDEYGVSGHNNHIGCFNSIQYLYSNGFLPRDVEVFVLESVSILRKYISFCDLIISRFRSRYIYISNFSNVLSAYSAMREHKTQLVWFRYLYMIFSRYIFINTFKRIHMKKMF